MGKRLYSRAVAALLILLFLLYAGPRVGEGTGESFYVKSRRLPEPEYVGAVTLYHVVTCRTYQGSTKAAGPPTRKLTSSDRGTFALAPRSSRDRAILSLLYTMISV